MVLCPFLFMPDSKQTSKIPRNIFLTQFRVLRAQKSDSDMVSGKEGAAYVSGADLSRPKVKLTSTTANWESSKWRLELC